MHSAEVCDRSRTLLRRKIRSSSRSAFQREKTLWSAPAMSVGANGTASINQGLNRNLHRRGYCPLLRDLDRRGC